MQGIPTAFVNQDEEYLRNVLCVALSNIRAKDGYTPLEVVKILLDLSEDAFSDKSKDLSSSKSSSTTATPSSSTVSQQQGSYKESMDTTYYKSILLMALSRMRLSSEVKGVDSWLKRILKLADECLASIRLQPIENDYRQMLGFDHHVEHVGGGILCSAALTCLSEMDDQLGGKWSRNYISYIGEKYPPLVRITALECYIRLSLSMCFTR